MSTRSPNLLEIIHTEICEPFSTATHNGLRYLLSSIDDFPATYVLRIADKSNALDVFMIYKTKVKHQLAKTIKIVRSNHEGEYYGSMMMGPFGGCGIVAEYTMIGTRVE